MTTLDAYRARRDASRARLFVETPEGTVELGTASSVRSDPPCAYCLGAGRVEVLGKGEKPCPRCGEGRTGLALMTGEDCPACGAKPPSSGKLARVHLHGDGGWDYCDGIRKRSLEEVSVEDRTRALLSAPGLTRPPAAEAPEGRLHHLLPECPRCGAKDVVEGTLHAPPPGVLPGAPLLCDGSL